MTAEPPDTKCVERLYHIRSVIILKNLPGLFTDAKRRLWNLQFDQKRNLAAHQDSTSVKSGIVSFVFCNRQLCNFFKGSDSMVSGRPQIRDRSSSWNTTSFPSLVRWTSSSIPYPWEIAARKEGMEFSGIPFSIQ